MNARYVVKGATLRGVEAVPVDVEVLISSGLPAFSIVGMADAAVQEARERVRAAIRACGFIMPTEKVVINLAPGALKKTGSGFDLPIAVGLLAATNQISPEEIKHALLVGELSLEGQVRSVKGILAYAVCARAIGCNLISAASEEGTIELSGLKQLTIASLNTFRSNGLSEMQKRRRISRVATLDYSDIAGHESAKRALQIAAAGNHGVLMMGPPGSGKTMLASRFPTILPPLDENERLETALIHSVAGEDIGDILAGIRPFRKPHHSASLAGLIGGGSPPRPGEASLAHNGVLFLDEFAEFKPSTLQGIRQPMESGSIAITRADGNINFPAQFMLIAATNPCPCGYYGDAQVACRCSSTNIRNYQNRIGGPLMDRIDMHIDVWRSDPRQVLETGSGISSEIMREAVLKAIEFRHFREQADDKKFLSNRSAAILKSCKLSTAEEQFLEEISLAYNLSGRSIIRMLSLARTIADLDESKGVTKVHLCEAVNLRIAEGIGALI